MKKALYILMAAAAFALCSCVVDDSTQNPRSSYSLSAFCETMIRKVTVNSVLSLEKMKLNGKDIYESDLDFSTVYYDDIIPTFKFMDDYDHWLVTGDNGTLSFRLVITRKEGAEGRDSWTCSQLTAKHVESPGYWAEMSLEGDVVFDWVSTAYAGSVNYRLEQSGKYLIITYRDGKEADFCHMYYQDGKAAFQYIPASKVAILQ